MVWVFELASAAILIALALYLFREKPAVAVAALAFLALFLYPRLAWYSSDQTLAGTAAERLALWANEALFRTIPLDSRSEQANWAPSQEREMIFRADGIHIYFSGNCFQGASATREMRAPEGFSFVACSKFSGGDGTSAYLETGKGKSAPFFIPPNSCRRFFVNGTYSEGNVTFHPFFSGEIADEEVILKSISFGNPKRSSEVTFSISGQGALTAEYLIASKMTSCASPCRRIIEGDSIALDYCGCSVPSRIEAGLPEYAGKSLSFLACAGGALSGGAGFSVRSDGRALLERTLAPKNCERLSYEIPPGNFSIEKAPVPAGAACGDETVFLSEFLIEDYPQSGYPSPFGGVEDG